MGTNGKHSAGAEHVGMPGHSAAKAGTLAPANIRTQRKILRTISRTKFEIMQEATDFLSGPQAPVLFRVSY